MKPNNNIPQRKSPRAHWLDYNDGRYFVTVCTHGHEHYLGFIENDVMTLSDVGMFLDNQLRNATMHQSYVSVLQHVVMPNHFHAIIEVDSEIVGTRHGVSVKNVGNADAPWRVPTADERMDNGINNNRLPLLSTFICSLKSAVTRYANAHHFSFAWQPRYHDHAIRDHNDYGNISDYITHNVLNWENDCFKLYKMKK